MTKIHRSVIQSVIQERDFIIGLVAGEASGDILAAGLIYALKQKISNVYFVGVTGPLMEKEGCQSWYKIEDISVMGILEALKSLPRLLQIRSDLTRRFTDLHPDVFIGIDFPDFNIPLERKLKRIGIKTIHYVSPSIWAWRKYRIFRIRKAVDMVFTLLPFEKRFYDRYHIPCRFIGHSTADNIPLQIDKKVAKQKLSIDKDVKCLAILPGSRESEVKMLSKDFLYAALILLEDFPKLQILVAIINQKCRYLFEKIYRNIAPSLPLKILDGKARLAMMAADVTLLASGTASLECMLLKCPMVVGYKMQPVTYWIAKCLVKVPFISLPNLLAGKALVNEFVQHDCDSDLLANSLKFLLKNENRVEQLKKAFLELHKSIRCYADQKAAEVVLEMIKYK